MLGIWLASATCERHIQSALKNIDAQGWTEANTCQSQKNNFQKINNLDTYISKYIVSSRKLDVIDGETLIKALRVFKNI